jgi:hypothetical protein
VELKDGATGAAILSGLFQLATSDAGRSINLAVARFSAGAVGFPNDVSVEALALRLSATVVRLHDHKCMAVCVDSAVADVEEGYIYMDTHKQGAMIPPHLHSIFGECPSDLTPQLCLESPQFTDEERTSLSSFESISIGYFDPFDDSRDLSVVSWLHMWRHIENAWF